MSKITIDVKNKFKASKLGKASEKFKVTFSTLGAQLIYTNVVNPYKFIMEMIDESSEDITNIQLSPMA